MKIVLVFLAMTLAPSVQACILDVPDEEGDANPAAAPPFFDLTGVHLEVVDENMTWAWEAPGIEDSVGIRYWAGLRLAAPGVESMMSRLAEGPPQFHPNCIRYVDPAGIPSTECSLTKSTELPGNAVTFELVQFLNWTLDEGRLTVSFPLSAIGLEAKLRIDLAYASTLVTIAYDTPGPAGTGGLAYPESVDRVDNWTWDLCWPEESEPVPAVATPTLESKEAPTLPGLFLFVVSALAAAWRRKQ